MQSDSVNIWYCKLRLSDLTWFSLNYLRSTTLDCKVLGIKNGVCGKDPISSFYWTQEHHLIAEEPLFFRFYFPSYFLVPKIILTEKKPDPEIKFFKYTFFCRIKNMWKIIVLLEVNNRSEKIAKVLITKRELLKQPEFILLIKGNYVYSPFK